MLGERVEQHRPSAARPQPIVLSWESADARPAPTPPPRRADQRLPNDLVSIHHVYRHLEATFDLSFVRDWTRELLAERGRPAVDPVVVFTLQLVMVCEGFRSKRQLIATASLHLAGAFLTLVHWWLDHGSAYRPEQMEAFFQQLVLPGIRAVLPDHQQ
jgi:hypothetical protein